MDGQDKKFNSKIIFAMLVAVIIGILIAFFYSYAQSQAKMDFLNEEKDLLIKDINLMKADVDRLSALDEVNEIELESSKFRVQQLLDSVGRLNFTVERLREFKSELRRLEAKNDSLKLKNNFLRYNNMVLSEKYAESKRKIEELESASNSLAEADQQQKEKIKELNEEPKIKNYLQLRNSEGGGFRERSGKPIRTNKASIIQKLRGCVTVVADSEAINEERIIYFQFLGPDMRVIEDNANTITVNGNVYSKRIKLLLNSEDFIVCDFITIPEGSLKEGIYTLNIFEDERLLTNTEFQLK
ncbi:hypothetical protein [uncultured Kriegella sp.]|uniref:hypothetical protein n=1 Tax=uncultured Kriegella sp. TaxID=1798910 RepID=UPI0030DC2B19|tara:strand:+ start:290333 stop:291229 length:897 start_codon:yes stop_codon:yes gene_type:complete